MPKDNSILTYDTISPRSFLIIPQTPGIFNREIFLSRKHLTFGFQYGKIDMSEKTHIPEATDPFIITGG